MTSPAETVHPGRLDRLLADLAPFPGRFQLTWQVALVCAISAGISMTYRVPEAAISLYLVIFLMKRDALNNCKMAIGLILLATVVVVLMIPLIGATIDSPAMRLVVIFAASYVFLYLSSATSLGEQAAIIGLIVAFIMTLVTDVPVSQIADQGLLMAWKMVAVPMVVMFVFCLFSGPSPTSLAREKIVERLRRAAGAIASGQASGDLHDLVGEGNQEEFQRLQLAALLHLAPRAETRWLTGALETSYRILLGASGSAPANVPARTRELAQSLTATADRIEAADRPLPGEEGLEETSNGDSLQNLIEGLSAEDGGSRPRFVAPPLLSKDAFTNPDHQRFALKTSAAAVICYLIYTGIQWDGIHTAMITCYVASLGSVGETVHKLLLRICGCLIGAGLGVAALLFVMPHLTTIAGLMALVFCGVLAGAWVSSGNERINYAGVQIALAFLLTVLNDFGPSFEFSQASDRIMGILVGNLVVFLVFTRIWPKSAIQSVRARIASAVELLGEAAGQPSPDDRIRHIAEANTDLAEADRLMEIVAFEPSGLRPSRKTLAHMEEIISQLQGLSIAIATDTVHGEAAVTALRSLSDFSPVVRTSPEPPDFEPAHPI